MGGLGVRLTDAHDAPSGLVRSMIDARSPFASVLRIAARRRSDPLLEVFVQKRFEERWTEHCGGKRPSRQPCCRAVRVRDRRHPLVVQPKAVPLSAKRGREVRMSAVPPVPWRIRMKRVRPAGRECACSEDGRGQPS
jgi:hypothetical protein